MKKNRESYVFRHERSHWFSCMVYEILRTDGYLLVDEIQNYYDNEMASTIIQFLMDRELSYFCKIRNLHEIWNTEGYKKTAT